MEEQLDSIFLSIHFFKRRDSEEVTGVKQMKQHKQNSETSNAFKRRDSKKESVETGIKPRTFHSKVNANSEGYLLYSPIGQLLM